MWQVEYMPFGTKGSFTPVLLGLCFLLRRETNSVAHFLLIVCHEAVQKMRVGPSGGSSKPGPLSLNFKPDTLKIVAITVFYYTY